MKRLYLLCGILLTLLLPATAQQVQLQIDGTAPTEMQLIYLYDIARQQPVDSVVNTSGAFHFSRQTEAGSFYKVGVPDVMFLLLSDGTPISINFNRGTLTGSSLNERLHRYDLQASNLEMSMQYAYMAGNKPLLDSLRTARQKLLKYIVSENADNLIPAYYINELAYFCPYAEMKQLLSPDKPYADHPIAQPARTMLADYELKMPGRRFHEMSMPDSFNRLRQLSEWCGQGKYVLLHFWSSTADDYLRDLRRIVYCYEEFHPKGLEVVGISSDTDKQQWLRAINELHMLWPQLCDLKANSAASETWGIHTLPANVLIAPDGYIVAANLFNGDLEDKLEEIFGE